MRPSSPRLVVFFALLLSAGLARAQTEVAWDWMDTGALGQGLAGYPDVDEDGVNELLVGQSLATDPDLGNPGSLHGRIFRVSGATGDVIDSVYAPDDNRYLGTTIATIGDVTGDDIPDILGSAPGDGNQLRPPGIVYVLSGDDLSVHCSASGVSNTGLFGIAVADIGDITGDDVPDFVATEPGAAVGPGRATAFSGADCSPIAGMTFFGTSNDAFGTCAAGLGDVTGDGVPDFAIGARRAEPTGKDFQGSITVISGDDGDEILVLAGPDRSSFGAACANVGDVNGDGVDDLGVGAPNINANSGLGEGEVFVFSGATSKKLWSARGTGPNDNLGAQVAGAGDVTGDGLAELIVGAPFAGPGSEGQLVVLSGDKGKRLLTFTGDAANGRFGSAVASLHGEVDDEDPDVSGGAPTVSTVTTLTLKDLGPPAKLKWGTSFTRTPAFADGDDSAALKLNAFGPKQSLKLTAKKLDPGGPYELWAEDEVGAGTFSLVTGLAVKGPAKGGTAKLALKSDTGAPPETGLDSLKDWVGRRLQIRNGGVPVLEALVPTTAKKPNIKIKAKLEDSGLQASLKAAFAGSKNTSKFQLGVKGLDKNGVYELWLEDGVGAGTYSLVGELIKGKFTRDTKKGDPLPGDVDGIEELSGRKLRVREGLTVLAEFEIP